MVLVLLAASSLKNALGLQTYLAALAITTVLCIKSRSNPIRLAREISWGTLILASTQKFPPFGALVVGFTVGVANDLVNNLPLGLIVGGTLPGRICKGSYRARRFDWRRSWTKPLGDRFARYNSLAPRPAQGKARCNFWRFLKIGVVAMPIALLSSIGGAILMDMLFHTSYFKENFMNAGCIIP
jgi:arsenical pump membrane protein